MLQQLEGSGNVQKDPTPSRSEQPQHSHTQPHHSERFASGDNREAQATGSTHADPDTPTPSQGLQAQPSASPPAVTAPRFGHAAGPKWTQQLQLHLRRRNSAAAAADDGARKEQREGVLTGGELLLELNALVASIGSDRPGGAGADAGPAGLPGSSVLDTKMAEGEWPAYVWLTNGKVWVSLPVPERV